MAEATTGVGANVVVRQAAGGWRLLEDLAANILELRETFGPRGVILLPDEVWVGQARAVVKVLTPKENDALRWAMAARQLLETLENPRAFAWAALGQRVGWTLENALYRLVWRGPLGPTNLNDWKHEINRKERHDRLPPEVARQARQIVDTMRDLDAELNALRGTSEVCATLDKYLTRLVFNLPQNDANACNVVHLLAEQMQTGRILVGGGGNVTRVAAGLLDTLIGRWQEDVVYDSGEAAGGVVGGGIRVAEGGVAEAEAWLAGEADPTWGPADWVWVGVVAEANQENLQDLAETGPPMEMAGAWRGGQVPVWSPSLLEKLGGCPFRALAVHGLKLEPLADLGELPDGRAGGLVVHGWLEEVGTAQAAGHFEGLSHTALAAKLAEVAEPVLARASAVVAAVWRVRVPRLAEALADLWHTAAAEGWRVAAVEREVGLDLGEGLRIKARLDRVEQQADGPVRVVDFKTGTPPSWEKARRGEAPQLPVEGWLLWQAGVDVAELQYIAVRGYGREAVRVSGKTFDPAWADETAAGVADYARVFGGKDAVWRALPGRKNGRWDLTGVCEHCPLGGVCRRHGEVQA